MTAPPAMPRRPATPSAAELELAEAHQGQALVDGNDSCGCMTCCRVEAYYDLHTVKSAWMSGGAL